MCNNSGLKYIAFICRSDSRSALRKQFHPNNGIMGAAIFRGFSLICYTLHPIFEQGDTVNAVSARLTLQCMQGWERKQKHCIYSCRHMETQVTMGKRNVRPLIGVMQNELRGVLAERFDVGQTETEPRSRGTA